MVLEMDMLRVAVGHSRYLGSSFAFPALEGGRSAAAEADSGCRKSVVCFLLHKDMRAHPFWTSLAVKTSGNEVIQA
jgi:hypothetical protein